MPDDQIKASAGPLKGQPLLFRGKPQALPGHVPRGAGSLPGKPGGAWGALLAGTLAAALPAATPEYPLQELEEIQVTDKTARPLEDYVEFPRYDSVAISPGGTRLAMGWTVGATYQRQVSVTEFPSLKPLGSQLLRAPLGVSDVRFVNEVKLLVQPEWPWHGFVRYRAPLGTIMVLDNDGSNPREFSGTAGDIDPIGTQRRDEAVDSGPKQLNTGRRDHPDNGLDPARAALGPLRLIDARIADPGQVLIQTLRTDRDGNTDGYGAFLLDVRSGHQKRVALLPLPSGQMITGPGHQVALVSGNNARHEQVVYYLEPEARAAGEDWQLRVKTPSGQRGLQPVAWSGDGEQYYALDGRDLPTRAVVVWDAASNSRRVLFRDPEVDMQRVWLDPSGRPWMFSGHGHFPVYWYPDPGHPLAELHQKLVRQLPQESVYITSATDDLTHAVVHVSSAHRPPLYMVLNVSNVRSVSGMQTYPKLRGTRIAPVEAIEFRARDGLVLHAYLTTPLDAFGKPQTGAPLLVISHDGSTGEVSSYEYEYERQLFASRDYAVLQVNHRGSSGRGRAFERLGDGQWGRAVQDDFADAVRWAIHDGVAAAGRICFLGTGYGAFSAMIAAAREPDLFQCVVGVAGIYDMPRMVEHVRDVPPYLQQAMGSDAGELLAISPVSHAKDIKADVLLLAQQNDEHGPYEQSTRMRSALKSAGHSPQWEVIGKEESGYHNPQNRANVYTKILRYLDKQIGKKAD